MEIEIFNITYGSKEYFDTLTLRNEVFRKPYGLDIKDDDLESDKNLEMYGIYIGDKLIGTVFLGEKQDNTAHIKALALLEEFRGIGLGEYAMKFIEDVARKKGYSRSYLNGRVYAENFYHRLGYNTIGEPYEHKTIPHVEMEKNL